MLYFLDAQYNVKGRQRRTSPVKYEALHDGRGNYAETDVREGARRVHRMVLDNLTFKGHPAKHDEGVRPFSRTGHFDGVDAVKIIFEQPVTAEYLAARSIASRPGRIVRRTATEARRGAAQPRLRVKPLLA